MKIVPFAVEEWMNRYETDAVYNIAETCVDSLTLGELVDDVPRFFAALAARKLTYGDIEGSPAFRRRVAALYDSEPRVVATQGAIGANFLVFFTLIEPGDRVIAVHPTYQQLYEVPRALGATVHPLRLRPENGYLPDVDELRERARRGVKLIVLNNPNNPTGALMPEAMLLEIVAIADEAGAYVLCDEVYRDLLQKGVPAAPSIIDLYDRGISTGSMSKVFSLAGLRLGWVAAAEPIVAACLQHRDYTTISCGMLDDALAVRALERYDAIMRRNLAIVRGNLAVLDEWVQEQPHVDYVKPKAGTTALLRYDLPLPSAQLCEGLMRETGTLLTPGSCFEVEGTVRIGYANAAETLRQGLGQFGAHLARLG